MNAKTTSVTNVMRNLSSENTKVLQFSIFHFGLLPPFHNIMCDSSVTREFLYVLLTFLIFLSQLIAKYSINLIN